LLGGKRVILNIIWRRILRIKWCGGRYQPTDQPILPTMLPSGLVAIERAVSGQGYRIWFSEPSLQSGDNGFGGSDQV
jgi:hypothetical protein